MYSLIFGKCFRLLWLLLSASVVFPKAFFFGAHRRLSLFLFLFSYCLSIQIRIGSLIVLYKYKYKVPVVIYKSRGVLQIMYLSIDKYLRRA